MKRNVQLKVLVSILMAGMMFSSCGNIDIVKRKYRPGFHVDVSKKKQKQKVVEQSELAEKRSSEKMKEAELKTPKLDAQQVDDVLTADNSNAIVLTTNKQKMENIKNTLRSDDVKGLSFEQKMKSIKREVFKPTKAPVAGTDWMKWVSFGTGIGSLAFGAMALIFAILTVVFFSSFVWGAAVLALLLGGAAITFSVLHKKNNGTGSQARLGFIFGIIGAGLAVLAIILGAIFFTIFVL